MPGDAPIAAVKPVLLAIVGALDAPLSFSDALRIPLRQPGKVLGDCGRPLWVQLVLAACAATGGDPDFGARVAAGVECAMAALDLLDEIEDGDASPTVEAVGTAQALNVATALLLLGQRALLDLPPRADLPAPADFARALTAGILAATGGQHLDLTSPTAITATMDDALAIARRKAGALAGMACRLGAMVGTADVALLDRYGTWGLHYGTAAQLSNDLHDAVEETAKSDLAQQKPTLPLLFRRRAALAHHAVPGVAASGALHFTWVVVEIEREACRSLTEELAARGQDVASLRQIVK